MQCKKYFCISHMITWSYTLDNQKNIHNYISEKLKSFDFFQNLHFYVLPFMPLKFRARVIYYPKAINIEKLFYKQKNKIKLKEHKWKLSEKKFLKKLAQFFPEVENLKIHIQPSLIGTIGSYEIKGTNCIYLYPRYDRKIISIQKLLINVLTHYFYFDPNDDMKTVSENWYKKQEMAKKIQEKIFPKEKFKSMTEVLDRQFSGKLAEASIKYLKELGLLKLKLVSKPYNLTLEESLLFDLLAKNKNKVVDFDMISDAIWKDKSIDKYSEYAITKLVERLKKKLPKGTIHPQRGIGYILITS